MRQYDTLGAVAGELGELAAHLGGTLGERLMDAAAAKVRFRQRKKGGCRTPESQCYCCRRRLLSI